MKARKVKIVVKPIVPEADRSFYDKEEPPDGTYFYDIEHDDPDTAHELAKDIFHSTVPIEVLDNFDIEVTSEEREVPCPKSST